jgi:hypothetical protein
MSSKDRVGAVLSLHFALCYFPVWLDVDRSVGPCVLSSINFTFHLFEENCSTTVEKSHLALEPVLSAETCHLDARKSYYAGLK